MSFIGLSWDIFFLNKEVILHWKIFFFFQSRRFINVNDNFSLMISRDGGAVF